MFSFQASLPSSSLGDTNSLINYGVDVDAIDPLSGRSALHEACKHGHGGMARVLLKEGERALATADKEGKTPLHWVGQMRAEGGKGGCERVGRLHWKHIYIYIT